MIIWITGLSGAGKTTLGRAIYDALVLKDIKNIIWLDGDVVRKVLSPDLDYSEESRIMQVQKVQSLAKYLESQNQIVIASILYFNDSLSKWNRKNFRDYMEIYIKVTIDKLIERDSKELYGKALSGEINNVVGVDIKWTDPEEADITINNGEFYEVSEQVEEILNLLNKQMEI